MEEVNSMEIEKIFEKYKREILQSKKTDPSSIRFFHDKMNGIYDISNKFHANKEVQETIKQNEEIVRRKNLQQKMEHDKAVEILKNVFPKFTPKPQTYILAKDEMINNISELMMLEDAYRHYLRLMSMKKLSRIDMQKDDFVPGHLLLASIRKLYPFQPSEEERKEYKEAVQKGQVEIISNKYENEICQKKQVVYSGEEIIDENLKNRDTMLKQENLDNKDEKLNNSSDKELQKDEQDLQEQEHKFEGFGMSR